MTVMTKEQIEALLDGTTPGPWKVCETTIHGRKYGGCWVEGPDVDDGDGRPHGLLIPISGSGGSMSYTTRVVDSQDHDHNDANAHLIASAPDLANTAIALHADLAQAKADAKIAVALVVEKAVDVAKRHRSKVQINEPLWHDGQDWASDRIAEALEPLADTDAVAELAKLRADIARKDQAIEAWREDLTNERAERDRLAAENAALQARVQRLVGLLKKSRPSVANMAYGWPEDDELVKEIDAALAETQAEEGRG